MIQLYQHNSGSSRPALFYKTARAAVICATCIAIMTCTSVLAKTKAPQKSEFEKIIESYTFVGDFSFKHSERPISDELFWRYPFTVPGITFPIEFDLQDPNIELPATKGSGRVIQHLNRGRLLFLEGKYQEAKATWLAARSRFGKKFEFHRRNDYFIGLSFLKIAQESLKAGKTLDDETVRGDLANAATFLSWAFIVKSDVVDPVVSNLTPKHIYNLAAIYWQYQRYAGAYGAAEKGLNFLRAHGRKDFRPQFNRIIAESHIKNKTYLEAAQQLDVAIRQDQNPSQAAAMFARVGDIYFDLNNYELAEDAYHLAGRIDAELDQVNASQLILRGESLFWLGRFDEAQKVLFFALTSPSFKKALLLPENKLQAYAALRLADTYLARGDKDKAKLEYYKVNHRFRGTDAATIAQVREACLELPYYGGNNIRHARELLDSIKTAELPQQIIELGWACQVASYTERERTPEMLNRVKEFYNRYPDSRFLQDFFKPVQELQASHILQHFKNKDDYSAISFFEKNRKHLFPKIDDKLATNLFRAYVDTFQSQKAKEFWPQYKKEKSASDLNLIRQAVFLNEMIRLNKNNQPTVDSWHKLRTSLFAKLRQHKWTIGAPTQARTYIQRILHSTDPAPNLPWLYRFTTEFQKKDVDILCQLTYPITVTAVKQSLKPTLHFQRQIDQTMAAYFPALLKDDESCAIALIDLEALLIKDDSKLLVKKYQERADWKLEGTWLRLVWLAAERLFDLGAVNEATQLWHMIKNGAPPESSEARFAAARLDKHKTETEKLWQ